MMVVIAFVIILIGLLLGGCLPHPKPPLDESVELPKDFKVAIEPLKTPKLVCKYMEDNFKIRPHIGRPQKPYEMFLERAGDCDDFALFAMFVAHYHGYEVHQLILYFPKEVYGKVSAHSIALFKEGGCFTVADFSCYTTKCWKNFKDIAYAHNKWWMYRVYDIDRKKIEEGKR